MKRGVKATTIILLVIILVLEVIILTKPNFFRDIIYSDDEQTRWTYLKKQAEKTESAQIYSEVDNGLSDFLRISKECFWFGKEARCNGEIEDIKLEEHETANDVSIELTVLDNYKNCIVCSDEKNMGVFTQNSVKTYSLNCEVDEKRDVLAKIRVGLGLRLIGSDAPKECK